MKAIENEIQPAPSRAAYRAQATKGIFKGKHASEAIKTVDDPLSNVVPVVGAGPEPKDKLLLPILAFKATKYTVLESAGRICVPVVRTGDTSVEARVAYATREGSAKKGQDFAETSGTLEFKPGETEMEVEVKIIDDTAFEEDEDFFIDLTEVKGAGGKGAIMLGLACSARVVIIDDDEPGVLGFEKDQFNVTESKDDHIIKLVVERRMGGTGVIGCSYYTVDESAVEGHDYVKSQGLLTFASGQMCAEVDIGIKALGRYERTESFRVELTDPTGGAKLGGEAKDGICTVFIEADLQRKEKLDRMMSVMKVNWDKSKTGHSNWVDQFRDAIALFPGDDEDESPPKPTILDYTMHIVAVPWKLLFAFVPPTDYCGGWVCFGSSLIAIGVTTAVIGDLAMLLGCTMNCPDELTAITFVALGTSVPDTFASQMAAVKDPNADNSVGNVTGSNSVNVFLGLGLPWMIASIYWESAGSNDMWDEKYGSQSYNWLNDVKKGDAVFVVEAGSLAFSVIVFSACACVCMGVLYLRRLFCDGELGGPKNLKLATAAFFVLLWFVYIGLSAWKIFDNQDD